jgi:hypothetical protein
MDINPDLMQEFIIFSVTRRHLSMVEGKIVTPIRMNGGNGNVLCPIASWLPFPHGAGQALRRDDETLPARIRAVSFPPAGEQRAPGCPFPGTEPGVDRKRCG